jgi:hypothetical protein
MTIRTRRDPSLSLSLSPSSRTYEPTILLFNTNTPSIAEEPTICVLFTNNPVPSNERTAMIDATMTDLVLFALLDLFDLFEMTDAKHLLTAISPQPPWPKQPQWLFPPPRTHDIDSKPKIRTRATTASPFAERLMTTVMMTALQRVQHAQAPMTDATNSCRIRFPCQSHVLQPPSSKQLRPKQIPWMFPPPRTHNDDHVFRLVIVQDIASPHLIRTGVRFHLEAHPCKCGPTPCKSSLFE